jgi:S1-C subfamily serine protease
VGASICVALACWSAAYADVPSAFAPEQRQAVLAATVRIIGTKPDRVGSGVAIGLKDEFCYVLTARHVVDQCLQLDVYAHDDMKVVKFDQVTIVADLPESDLALVRFVAGNARIACLPLAKRKPVLDKFPFAVLNAGWQKADGPTCFEDTTLARVLLLQKEWGDTKAKAFFWRTQSISEEGRSGGPLVNRDGRVIGICSGNQDGKGYFTDLDEIHYLIRKHSSCPWLLPKDA